MMSRDELTSIYRMEFYKKQPKWVLTSRSRPDLPPTPPWSPPSPETPVQGTQTTNPGGSALNETFDVIDLRQEHNEVSSHSNGNLKDEFVDSWLHAATRSRERDILAEADELMSEPSFCAGASVAPHSSELDLRQCTCHLSEMLRDFTPPVNLGVDQHTPHPRETDLRQHTSENNMQQHEQSYDCPLLYSCANLMDWPEEEQRHLEAMLPRQLAAYAQRELQASERHLRRHAHLITFLNNFCNLQGQQNAPVNEQHVPVNHQQIALVNQQHAPVNQQHAPVNEQHVPVNHQQIALVNQQHAPVNQQHALVNQQRAPIDQQHAPVNQQHAPVNQQHAPANQQHVPINQQNASINQLLINQQRAPVSRQSAPVDAQHRFLNLQHVDVSVLVGRGRGRLHRSPNPGLPHPYVQFQLG